MKRKFIDSAIAPIIAWDFDDTININGSETYPKCGEVRKYAKEVINLLHEIGVKNVIWTSRDVAYNQDEKIMYDHLTPMIEFLDNNDIHYDAINKSVQFAPYVYNGRKIYAHTYIDDRAFGWKEHDTIMLEVLYSILTNIVGADSSLVTILVCDKIESGKPIREETLDALRYNVKHWKD